MGKKLFKKYRLIRKLRSVQDYLQVYLAKQAGLDRAVELRLLNRPKTHGSDDFKRIQREFKSLAKLDHPNIIRVLDVGYTKTRIFYTTEHRRAVSLENLLKKVKGPLTRQELAEVANAIGDALDYIHRSELLHRNISTSTVFYDLDNKRPYISDFSLLKQLESISVSAVSVKRFLSTPTPELFDEKPFDHLTDLFLFGAMLYRLATYSSPIKEAECVDEVHPDKLFDITPPTKLNPKLPKRWGKMIMKLLERDRARRYDSIKDFLTELKKNDRVMSAESLIKRERQEVLKEIRNTMKLKSPTSEQVEGKSKGKQGAKGSGESKLEQGSAGSAGSAGSIEYEGATGASKPWRVSSVVLAAGAFAKELAGRGDSNRRLAFLSTVVVFIGGLLFLFLGGQFLDGPSNLSLPDEGEMAKLRANRKALEDEILKITATLKFSGIPESQFLGRWKILKAYLRCLDAEEKRKVLDYSELLAIKLRFRREPVGAIEELKEAFKLCERHIKGD